MSRLEFALRMREEHPEYYFPNFGVSSHVDPSVRVPEWVTIGENVVIHAGVVFGAQGFGFVEYKGKQLHIPHIGGIVIGDDVEVFENTLITRGTVGNTVIGDGSKIDGLIHIAHNVTIGKNTLIASGGLIGGSVEIGDRVFIGSKTVLRDHVKVASGTIIGCGSNIVKDIVEESTVWAGNPARFLRWRRDDE
jgi:UDP-3-O-[3-hydroxymyristoyl] glucosamine N-acyltransferase